MKKYQFFAPRLIVTVFLGVSIILVGVLGTRSAAAISTYGQAGWREIGNFLSFLPLLPRNWMPPVPPGGVIRITEVYYDPTGSEPSEEWIEIFNPGPEVVDLSEYKIGDEETPGGGEGMYHFPPGAQLAPGDMVVVANQAASFNALYGFQPDYEMRESDPLVLTLVKHSAWAGGSVTLLNTSDEVLVLDENDDLVDAVSWGGSTFAFNPAAPDVAAGHSLERAPAYRDTDTADDWYDQSHPNPGLVDLSTPTPVPTATPSETPSPTSTEPAETPVPTNGPSPSPTASIPPGMGTVLISEVLYDPAGDEPQAEWVEIFNPGTGPIDLSLFKVGDEEESGGGEGMYSFPEGSLLNSGTTFLVANRADEFINRYGFSPDFELIDSDAGIPDMIRYQSWASGNISLGNSGDEILLLDETDNLIDAISWGISTFAFDPAAPDISEGNSLERVPADNDTDSAADWVDQANPDPGGVMVENFSIDLTRDHRGLSSEKFIAPRPTRTPRIRATPTIRPTRPIPGRTPTATRTIETPVPATPTLPPPSPSPTSIPATATPLPSATPTEIPLTATPTLMPEPSATSTPTESPTNPPPEPSPTPGGPTDLLISEVFYDTPGTDPAEEWIEIINPTVLVVDLTGYKIGDEELAGGSEGMFQFPDGALIAPGDKQVVALQAVGFSALYGFNPDYELSDTDASVATLVKYESWGSGTIAMSNSGDEIVILDPMDNPVDVVTYEGGSYPGVTPHTGVSTGHSMERIPPEVDTNDCSIDFIDQENPTPGS